MQRDGGCCSDCDQQDALKLRLFFSCFYFRTLFWEAQHVLAVLSYVFLMLTDCLPLKAKTVVYAEMCLPSLFVLIC